MTGDTTHCPSCGEDGTYGEIETFTRDVNGIDNGNDLYIEVRETWKQYHCPNCHVEYAVRDGVEEL